MFADTQHSIDSAQEGLTEQQAQQDALLLTQHTQRRSQAEQAINKLGLGESGEDDEYQKQLNDYHQKFEQRERGQKELLTYILSKEGGSTVSGVMTDKGLQVSMTYCGETASNNMRNVCKVEAGGGHGVDFGSGGNPDYKISRQDRGNSDFLSQIPDDCKALAIGGYPRAVIDYLKKMDQEKGTHNASKYEQFGHAAIAVKMDLDGDGTQERGVIDPYFQKVFPEYIQRIGETPDNPNGEPIQKPDGRRQTTKMIKPIPAEHYFKQLGFELKQGAAYTQINIDKALLDGLQAAPKKPIKPLQSQGISNQFVPKQSAISQ